MAVEHRNLSDPAINLADDHRSLFSGMERSVTPVCVLDASTRRLCDQRFFAQLEPTSGVCFSPLLANRQMSIENQERESRINIDLPTMANAVLVSASAADGMRYSESDQPSVELAPIVSGNSSSTIAEPSPSSVRLEVVRQKFGSDGLSSDVIDLLLAGNRNSTTVGYQSAWTSWYYWNLRRGSDPLSNNLANVLKYLSDLQSSGKSYSTINLHRSMLSQTLDPVDGTGIGQHTLVKRLMKGCFNVNPPKPRYESTWDPNVVLQLMVVSGPNEELNFKFLTRKMVTAIALASLLRVSEIASIAKDSVIFSEHDVRFSLLKPRKSQKSGPLQSFCIKRATEPLVCPVDCIGQYVYRTDFIRNDDNMSNLLVALKKPHRKVTGSTVGKWIKSFLIDAGVDASFSAHSTRGAAASKALKEGVSLDEILKSASWANESTFSRYYHRCSDSLSVDQAIFGHPTSD